MRLIYGHADVVPLHDSSGNVHVPPALSPCQNDYVRVSQCHQLDADGHGCVHEHANDCVHAGVYGYAPVPHVCGYVHAHDCVCDRVRVHAHVNVFLPYQSPYLRFDKIY